MSSATAPYDNELTGLSEFNLRFQVFSYILSLPIMTYSTDGLTYCARVYLWAIGLAPVFAVTTMLVSGGGPLTSAFSILLFLYFVSILFSVPAFLLFWIFYLLIKKQIWHYLLKKFVLFVWVVILLISTLHILKLIEYNTIYLLLSYLFSIAIAFVVVKLP